MQWAEEMLQDEDLIHHFVWDAQHVSKFNSSSRSWVRVIDEPWTANHFWETQVSPYTTRSDSYHLTSLLLDKYPKRWKAPHILFFCRQDKALLFWYPEGLPSDCALYKSSCQLTEWNWHWGGENCWMAPNCELMFISSTVLILISYH